MSEYQYYDFRAVDRPLTPDEMDELRRYSTRAEITSTSFTNEYNWGDFKGDPWEWMKKYFDAFLYFANWGSRTLSLKVPGSILPAQAAELYCTGESCSHMEHEGSLIITFDQEGDGEDDFYESPAWSLASLLPLRNELCRGDLRALYLGWLMCVQLGQFDDDEIEPPVPPNLQQLSPALVTLADFLRLDPDLVAFAADRSPNIRNQQEDPDRMRSWIATLSADTKDEMLLRVMEGRDAHVADELWRWMKRDRSVGSSDPVPEEHRRSVSQLLEGAGYLEEERVREEARKAAEEKARKAREGEESRKRHLDALSGREEELWERVDELVAMTQPKPYGEAIVLLADLRDLARRSSSSDFSLRLAAFRAKHRNKPSLLTRLLKAGL